ncbi:flippase [Halarchaeum nitratireducens]|uniref:Polysaccharide biosynthesis protein n=1 Tax=Halarchaeum nitratireducens TaxID=489913 RepID=A0A830GD87_9EURY|nr:MULTISPECIES: flippase [Halarchaeum]MBP2252623.1 O-antigen/teichoic acid export membrane protein [Halarchaeum solikamskense]GGN23744.1 polysaccharide biosynthesis protein [Halarchaeum nitratireducens]
MTDEDGFATIRSLFKGGGVVLLGLVLELAISFIAKVLIARSLGHVDYGAVSLGITTAAVTSTLVILGLHSGIGRYLPRYESRADRRSVLVSAFRVAFPLSLLVGAALFVLAPFLATRVFDDPSLTFIFRIFAVAIPFGAVMKLALGSVQGMQESLPKVVVQNVTFPVVRFLGIVVALLFGLGAIGVSYAYLASYAAAALVGLVYLSRRTPLFDRTVSTVSRERELLSFSLPLVASGAMTIVISDIDFYMLGAFGGTGAVGVYNVAYPLAQLLMTAMTAFGFVFMPILSELDASGEHDQMKRLYQLATRWVVLATLPLFLLLFLFPEQAIRYTFGAEYVSGAAALSVLAAGFFIHTTFGLNKGTLTSLGHTRLIMLDDIAAAVLNVLLNLVLIPKYGLLGAAYATTASYLLLNLLYSIQLYRRTRIQPFTRSLLLAPAIGAATLLALTVFGPTVGMSLPRLVGIFTVFLLVYGVAVVRYGVEPEDIRLLLSFEERFGVDLGPLKEIAKHLMG